MIKKEIIDADRINAQVEMCSRDTAQSGGVSFGLPLSAPLTSPSKRGTGYLPPS